MVDDEFPPSGEGDAVVPEGPRRSTYTPPPGGIRWEPPVDGAGVDSAGADSAGADSAGVQAGGRALPPPPVRRSLTNAELMVAADPASADTDSGALLDLVERQLELRRTEAAELADWERTVREAAPAEAETIVAAVRERFRDVLSSSTAAMPIQNASAEPSIAERLASAPPPPSSVVAAPALDLALADAPPPWGQVPSAVAPPPSAVEPQSAESPGSPDSPTSAASPVSPVGPPPLVEPTLSGGSLPGGAPPAESALDVFDELLQEREPEREPEREADSVRGHDSDLSSGFEPESPIDGVSTVAALLVADEPSRAGVEPVAEIVPETATDGAPAVSPVAPRAHRLEVVALEPTPAEQRAGRSIRMFWQWFAVNASVVSVALGAVILGLGLSLRQAILAALIGVALSALPLGLGTLASKWSGQPTMVVSRSTFGTGGNAIPAVVALVTRLAWAAALLWMLAAGTTEILVGAGLVPDDSRPLVVLVAAAGALLVVALIAALGFGAIARVAAVVSALSAVLVVGLIVLTASVVDLDAALALPDGDWLLMVGGGVVVFSVIGLAWAMSAGDVARYQARGTSGSATLVWAALGATVPAFVLIAWGAVLAASSPVIAEGLQQNPLDLISRLLPLWYPAPLVAAVALSLLAAASLALYSGGFAVLALGVRAPRWVGVLISVMVTGALLAVVIAFVPTTAALLGDVLTTAAVPVAAWAGIFAAETMIRTRRVHSPSLLRRGGVYPTVRWVNTSMLVVATGVGWGFTTATITGLSWQGYLFTPLAVPLNSALALADLGVLVALALGLLTPIVAGIPTLRRLQIAERAAADADDLAVESVSTQ